jgi:hypothetical protein
MRNRTISSYGLTLSQSIDYLRPDNEDEYPLIESLITASYEQVSAECNRDFTPATYSMNLYNSSGYIFLTCQTVNSCSLGTLKDINGAWYTLIPNEYSGPIEWTVADSGSVPKNVSVAQMILINNWYENRLPQVLGVSATNVSYSVESRGWPFKHN